MFSNLFSTELTDAFVWTIVHSLWQFTLIAICLSLFLKFAKNTKSSYKHLIAYGALGFAFLVSIVTFTSYYSIPDAITAQIQNNIEFQASVGLVDSSLVMTDTLSFVERYAEIIISSWLIGCCFFLLRFTGGIIYIKKLVKESTAINNDLSKSLKKLNKKFRIHRQFLVKESLKITTPMVTGFIKPVILFPLGLINQLSVQEVESILAHEMAHIKRHDYILNFIQSLAEVLFYYHPAIWFISNRIRAERENCCDDMAIQFSGSSISYAKTLVKLQELKGQVIQPALAFSGNAGSFKKRILRILGNTDNATYAKDKLVLAILLISGTATSIDNFENQEVKDSKFDIYVIDDCPMDPKDIKLYLDTIPLRNSYSIKKKTEEKEIELEMEDGQIRKLIIDGQKIASEDYEKHKDIVDDLIPDADQDLITLFPDCGDTFGKIYWLNKKDGTTVNLDSMLRKMHDNNDIFKKLEHPFFYDNDLGKIQDILIDTIHQEILSFDYFDKITELHEQKVDSVFDLFPRNLKRDDFFGFNQKEESNPWGNRFDPKRFEQNFEQNFNDNGFRFNFPEGTMENIFESNQKVTVADVISRSLQKDDIIEKDKVSIIEITGKHLKINGEKQPTNIWKKYKNIYERETGLILFKDSKIKFEVDPEKCLKKRNSHLPI